MSNVVARLFVWLIANAQNFITAQIEYIKILQLRFSYNLLFVSIFAVAK